MDHPFPFLEIKGPDGQQWTVELTKTPITIGRFEVFNDIALQPDPQQLIGRKGHCALEQENGAWFVVDNGSVNGTLLERGDVVQQVAGRAPLAEGDCIHILGRLSENEPTYWELGFHDPMGTRPSGSRPRQAALEYDWVQARLFRVDGLNRHEIRKLAPREHKLIRYMDQRNRANGGQPVMCPFEELFDAIWEDEPGHTEAEISSLVYDLRQKIEPDPHQPQFLQVVQGLGYRLVTRLATNHRRSSNEATKGGTQA